MSFKVVMQDGVAVAFGPNDKSYDPGLQPGQSIEIREAIPELPKLQEEIARAETLAKLEALDRQTIRGLREYIVAKPDAPQQIKDVDALAAAERGKLNVAIDSREKG